MAKTDPAAKIRERHKAIRWVVTIFLVTILVSGIISLLSDMLMSVSSMAVAFLILLVIFAISVLPTVIWTFSMSKKDSITG